MRWRTIKQKNNTPKVETTPKIHYVGFWSRFLAFITDIFMIGLPITFIIMMLFGYDQTQSAGFSDALMQTQKAQEHAPNPLASIVQFVLYSATFILLWKRVGQTPGMKIANITIVDAVTFERPSYLQLFTRFFSYFISLFLFGYLWGIIRKDKRMLPDLISRTTMIYKTH